MASRLEFHEKLSNILGDTNRVYFQPPTNIRMIYPCIRYTRDEFDTIRADNLTYKRVVRYQVMVIDPDPDSEILEKLLDLPYSSHSRYYVADNLNHDVFTIYF